MASVKRLYSATVRKLIIDSLVYTLVAAGNAIAVIFFVRVATEVLSLRSLDDIFLGRRYIPVFSALLSLGSSQVIQKYWTVEKDSPTEKLRILVATTIMCVTGFLVTAVFLMLVTALMGHDLQSHTVLYAVKNNYLLLAALSVAVGQIAASILLVDGRLLASGILQALNGSIISAMIIELIGPELVVSELFKWTAYCSLSISFATIIFSLQSGFDKSCLDSFFLKNYSGWLMLLKKCLTFGIPRSLSTAMDFGLFAITPWLVSNELGKAAVFSIALTLVKMSQLVLAPVSQIVALRVASFSSIQQQLRADRAIAVSVLVMVGVGIGSAEALYLSRNWLITLFVGDISIRSQISLYLRYFSFALPGLMIFYSMRSILELRFTAPVNLISLVLAITTHLGIYYMLVGYYICPVAAAYSFIWSSTVLGICTLSLACFTTLKNMWDIHPSS